MIFIAENTLSTVEVETGKSEGYSIIITNQKRIE